MTDTGLPDLKGPCVTVRRAMLADVDAHLAIGHRVKIVRAYWAHSSQTRLIPEVANGNPPFFEGQWEDDLMMGMLDRDLQAEDGDRKV
jgi:hypothetical protein